MHLGTRSAVLLLPERQQHRHPGLEHTIDALFIRMYRRCEHRFPHSKNYVNIELYYNQILAEGIPADLG
ncbi:MAG: hypothetical protein AVDCRST_MAG93-10001 [uncultured Chloroflexia bacterium]|uniref:Uncharacterized protein n=1 Tax=uncultured Chloroflexia bacterium TaxID=1672391 RepID=A0A6J4NRV9_9CHLR|nr:MAG: hypothetical protein AVDCRST_MAG93-10001 [uncultured Chloroflexia bacterium]